MIQEDSIQRVFEAVDIEEVIRDFVKLKKAGSNWKGYSPFTEERTPSFVVSPAKQIFKCFSTGKGGGAVSFLQEVKGHSFPEAIEYLAEKYNVELAYTGREASPEEKDAYKRLDKCIRAAKARWQAELERDDNPALHELLNKRELTRETIMEWELGFAPDAWDFIKRLVIDAGYYEEATELGLIRRKNENTYDFYRNRIIFPIRNHKNQLVSFGGRSLGADGAKYLNGQDSKIYKKEKILYGFHQAINQRIEGRSINPIREAGKVYLVEGYFDVISMHQAGIKNTVATSGTSLSLFQTRLISRHTNTVVLLRDGDKAGLKAAQRDLNTLIQEGFKVEIAVLDEGDDPDSIVRKVAEEETVKQ